MEYEFRRNTLTGTLMADFTMDHEIMGQWFADELGENKSLIEQIRQLILAVQQGRSQGGQFIGRTVSLELDTEQVRVFANSLATDEDIDRPEAMSLYEGESQASCGLEDFEAVLHNWQAFIDESR